MAGFGTVVGRGRDRSVGRSIGEVATSLNFPPFRAFDGAARTLAVISFVIDPVLLNTIACQDLDSLLCFHKLTDACWCAGAPSSSVALSGPRTSHLAPQTSKAPLRYDVCADTVTDADGRLHGQSSVLLVFRNIAAARPARAPSVAHEWRQEEVGEIRQGALARSSFLSITLFPLVPREHRSGDNG